MKTLSIRRDTIIRVAHDAGMTGLRTLLSVLVKTHAGACGAHVKALADCVHLHPRTVAKYIGVLQRLGFVHEQPARGRVWRRVVQSDADTGLIEMEAAMLDQHAHMGDALGLALLLQALGGGGTFVAKIDDICAAAGASRDTIDRHLRRLQDAGLVARDRVSRSEYKYRIVLSVPAGPSAKSTRLQRADSPAADGKWARIAEKLRLKWTLGGQACSRH
jgi:DNA-binding transcriptional ArsR family regulator